MKRKLLAALLTAGLAGSLLTGCAGIATMDGAGAPAPAAEAPAESTEAAEPATEAEADGDQLVVAFAQAEMNNAWRVAETASIEDEVAKRGAKLIYTDAGGDTAKQISDVEDILNQDPDVIFLVPREFEGVEPALSAAKDKGVPVGDAVQKELIALRDQHNLPYVFPFEEK